MAVLGSGHGGSRGGLLDHVTRAHPPPPPPPAVQWLRPLLLFRPPAPTSSSARSSPPRLSRSYSWLRPLPLFRVRPLCAVLTSPSNPWTHQLLPRHALSLLFHSSSTVSGLPLRPAPPPLFGYAPLPGLGLSAPPPPVATVQASPPRPGRTFLPALAPPTSPHPSLPRSSASSPLFLAGASPAARGCLLPPVLRALP